MTTISFATNQDHHEQIAWLRADDPSARRRVLVERATDDDGNAVVVGAAMRVPNPLHPALDFLQVALVGQATPELICRAADCEPGAAIMRALPGTPEHSLALEAGATVFETVPASRVDPGDPAVRAWTAEHEDTGQGLTTRAASEYSAEERIALWIAMYVASHQHFGVTGDDEVLRARLGPFVTNGVQTDLSLVVADADVPVALAFTFGEGEDRMALVDAIDPSHPQARQAVTRAMAALLRVLPAEPLEFDGHASSPHYPLVLARVPAVTSGRLTPMELLMVDSSG